jgi:FixJ family two-component response regulator
MTARNPAGREDRSFIAEVPRPTVVVVDDDPMVRETLKDLLSSVGLRVVAFGSARELLSELQPERTHCLVLDIRLPDRNGLELQEELLRANIALPVIFISGHADVRIAVRAMKAGAVDFLAKPFGEQEVLDAVQAAIRRDQSRREVEAIVTELQRHFHSLTAREQEMMAYVVSGRRNKEIAASMGVTEITVKAHRIQVMKKMGVRSVAALIGIAQLLGHEHAQPTALIGKQMSTSL